MTTMAIIKPGFMPTSMVRPMATPSPILDLSLAASTEMADRRSMVGGTGLEPVTSSV
jgi:hypothetical protein